MALGLPTVLGLKPRGWFIPHRYAPLLPPPGAQPPYPAIEALFERRSPDFARVIDQVESHAKPLEGLNGLLEQSWFPSLDASVAYTMVRERRPQKIVEVGSGHSTRVLARALGGVGEIVAIDPMPRADIAGLPGVRVVASTLQTAPQDLFDGLKPGDLLFIDSSHILMPGSDVDLLLNRVLPHLLYLVDSDDKKGGFNVFKLQSSDKIKFSLSNVQRLFKSFPIIPLYADMHIKNLLVVEGTIYPLLTRLKNAGLLQYRWEESKSGPPRKYYSLTDSGRTFLLELDSTWNELVQAVHHTTHPFPNHE